VTTPKKLAIYAVVGVVLALVVELVHLAGR
jgi:hypothetical protein